MHIVFSINNQYYAIFYGFVKKISMIETITPVPTTSKYILGTILVENESYTVINMPEVLGLNESINESSNENAFLIVSYKDNRIVVPVDSIVGMFGNLPEKALPIKSCDFLESLLLLEDGNLALSINIPKLTEFLRI